MATKKSKGKTKKTAGKKTAGKKTAGKKTRRAGPKKVKVPYAVNAERLSYFMGQLIQAGYAGKTIPDDNSKKKKIAQNLRQMAQQLDRQVHKTAT